MNQGQYFGTEKNLNNAHNGLASSVDNSFSTRFLMPSRPDDLPNCDVFSISLTLPGVIAIL